MTRHIAFRRTLVTLGVVGTLLVAGLTIRTAASWASTQAPLGVAPVSVESVQQALDSERARSDALAAQLRTLDSSTADLAAALDAAEAQVNADALTATDLRSALAAAQSKLAKLEASLKAASSRTTTTRTTTTRTTNTDSAEDREDEEEHDD
ncbi:MAG TPA: hypothetical protein VIF63_05525 [Candidatus Limnocylindrales bacterium]|jgi:Skp family chaperone for outer membrane proteins